MPSTSSILLLSFLVFWITPCLLHSMSIDTSALQLLHASRERALTMSSCSYQASVAYKFSVKADTIYRTMDVRYSQRHRFDTTPVLIWSMAPTCLIYDGARISLIDSSRRRIGSRMANDSEALGIIRKRSLSREVYFYQDVVNNSWSWVRYADTIRFLEPKVVERELCAVIEFAYHDEEIGDSRRILTISNVDTVIRRMEEILHVTAKYGGGYQYQRIDIRRLAIEPQLTRDDLEVTPPSNYIMTSTLEQVEETTTVNRLKVKSRLPEKIARTLDGVETTLSRYCDGITVIYFWRIGCPPTELSKQPMTDLAEEWRPKGVRFIGVNFVDSDSGVVTSYVRARPLPFPSLYMTKEDVADLGVTGNPEILVIDRRKRLLKHVGGYYRGFDDDLRRVIRGAVSKR